MVFFLIFLTNNLQGFLFFFLSFSFIDFVEYFKGLSLKLGDFCVFGSTLCPQHSECYLYEKKIFFFVVKLNTNCIKQHSFLNRNGLDQSFNCSIGKCLCKQGYIENSKKDCKQIVDGIITCIIP